MMQPALPRDAHRRRFHLESRRPRVPGISDIYNREYSPRIKRPDSRISGSRSSLRSLARETTDTCRVKRREQRPHPSSAPALFVFSPPPRPSSIGRDTSRFSRHSISASHFPFSAFKRSVNIPPGRATFRLASSHSRPPSNLPFLVATSFSIGGWKNRRGARLPVVSGLEFRLSGACVAATRGRVTRASASCNGAIKQMTRPTRANVPPPLSSSGRRKGREGRSRPSTREINPRNNSADSFPPFEERTRYARITTRVLTVAFRRQLPSQSRCRQIMCNFRDERYRTGHRHENSARKKGAELRGDNFDAG